MRPLLPLFALGITACASLHPIPESKRAPFFECPGVTLAQAELHLAQAGFVPKPAGKSSLGTEITEVPIEGEEARVWVPEASTEKLVDIHERARVRILVYEKGPESVRYKPFWGHREDVQTYRGTYMFPVAERLYYEQVRDEATFALLSQMYSAVCGSAPVGAPWGY